jgi:uncharacterized membrane protein HdeD (DUF308 family)
MDPTVEKIYEQANENWRFLAKWRQLVFAGYFAVVAGALSIINSAADHAYPLWVFAIFFFFLSWICFILFVADKRTHRLTMDACDAGVELEDGVSGFFTINRRKDRNDGVNHPGEPRTEMESSSKKGWLARMIDSILTMENHSLAVRGLFIGSGVIFLFAGAFCFCLWCASCGTPSWASGTSAAWEYTVVQGTVTSSSAVSGSLDKNLNRATADGWEFVAVGNDTGGGSFVILRRHKR